MISCHFAGVFCIFAIFQDQKPKLPYVKALPSKVDQLSRPFPEELEERWKGGTLNEDCIFFRFCFGQKSKAGNSWAKKKGGPTF